MYYYLIYLIFIYKNSRTLFTSSERALSYFQTSPAKGISAFPDGDNLFKWIGTIEGPQSTVSSCFPSNISFRIFLDSVDNFTEIRKKCLLR